MAIVETLTVELGTAIAKAILKVWLKDYTIASDITSDLLGLIKGKTKDVLAQNRAKRQFESIGEKVAEALLPLFEAEKAKIDENSQVAIAIKISEILNNSAVDAKLLADVNLEPSILLNYLRDTNPQRTDDFTKDETEFFERILSDICQNIVDIASELPNFTEQTLAEVLKRESELIKITETILEEVNRIRKSSERTDATAQASVFETEYRRAVVRKLDELELFGADVSRASKRHRLSVAYVTLSVEETVMQNMNDKKRGQEEQGKTSKNISVDEIILANPRLFIKGDAGSGKTTLLQWIAVRSASSDFKGTLAILNQYTPFFIRLRQCVDKGLPPPQEFPELIVPAIADTMPKGWVHEKLRSGNAIVLVDGLDEISQLGRNEVREWIRDLITHFPAARFILSSRPTAADEDWLKPEGFYESTLQSMTKQDIFAFIDHWHSAVADALQDQTEKDELKPLAEKLKSIIETNRSIYNLATTPLLCAMISALHRERRSQLPKDRIELYEACTSMLLERREIERKIDYRDYPSLTYRQKRALLDYFAYWLIKNKLSLVEIERADTHFEARLKIVEGLNKTNGSDIRRLFLERSGLLREPIKGSLHFAHRTFQEFLAAKAAVDEDDIGVLVSNAQDDQWREVVILAAGLSSQKKREELITELIKRGDNESNCRHQLHLLVVACLETSVLLAPEIKQEIEKRLKQLKLPKNMTEAKQWASAGELSIPYLSKGYKEYANIASACVRALLLIGGDVVLHVLENFAKDGRLTVLDELYKGSDYYDMDIYSKCIFSKNNYFARQFSKVTSLVGLEYLVYLQRLTVTGDLSEGNRSLNKAINNLDVISKLQDLSYLKISDFSYPLSLEPICKLPKLAALVLNNLNTLENLDDISQLDCVETLHITNCEALKNINSIRKFRNLRNLRIENCPNISDFVALSELVSLETLSLPRFGNLTNLDFLSNCIRLKYLGLPYCLTLNDISALSKLKNLETIVLSGCSQISDITSLSKLKNIRILDLALCTNADVKAIQDLKGIIFLSLMGIKIQDSKNILLSIPALIAVNLIGAEGIVVEKAVFKNQDTTKIIYYPEDIIIYLMLNRLEAIKRERASLSGQRDEKLNQYHWELYGVNVNERIEQLEKDESNINNQLLQLENEKLSFNSKELDIRWNLQFAESFIGSRSNRFSRIQSISVVDEIFHTKGYIHHNVRSLNNLLIQDLMNIVSNYQK